MLRRIQKLVVLRDENIRAKQSMVSRSRKFFQGQTRNVLAWNVRQEINTLGKKGEEGNKNKSKEKKDINKEENKKNRKRNIKCE